MNGKHMSLGLALSLVMLLPAALTGCGTGDRPGNGESTIPAVSDASTGTESVATTTTSGNTVQDPTGNGTGDKPVQRNTAGLINPIKSKMDPQADSLRNQILDAVSEAHTTGTVWYISNSGNDQNSGTSPDAAWASLGALDFYKDKIKPGDAVLLNRGDVFRGNIIAQSGIYYGAYGKGDKPCIYGSKENSAKAEWLLYEDQIWALQTVLPSDPGIVVLNHGEKIGVKKLGLPDLKEELDFFYEGGRLYMRCKEDPSSVYDSIEIGCNKTLFLIPENSEGVTVENLTFKYTGAHGLRALNGVKNITIKTCEFGWIGGSLLDDQTRYGNGIEFWQGCENILVEQCWIYQIYDSGITHQGTDTYLVKDLTLRQNLVEYCGMGSIEYWHNNAAQNSIENILYEKNMLRFVGYGWGNQRLDTEVPCHIYSNGANPNKAKNFQIRENIFELSTHNLLSIQSQERTLPALNGNTYIQTKGGFLGCYGSGAQRIFDDTASTIVKEKWGDTSAILEFA